MIGSNSIDYKQTEKCMEEWWNPLIAYDVTPTKEEVRENNKEARLSHIINKRLEKNPIIDFPHNCKRQ